MTVVAEKRTVSRKRDREHELDRMVAAATYRRERARARRAWIPLRVAVLTAGEGRVSPRRRAPGLFVGYWYDPLNGRRLQRASRREIATAYRLWAKHRDIREGRLAA